MFGHTLLRIDQADVQADKTSLLSYAINFGAYIEGSDNSILYAWKGLMGGYPGLFALVPYQENSPSTAAWKTATCGNTG